MCVCVYVCVCVCVFVCACVCMYLWVLITTDVKCIHNNQLFSFLCVAIDKIEGCDLSNIAHHEPLTKKTKVT